MLHRQSHILQSEAPQEGQVLRVERFGIIGLQGFFPSMHTTVPEKLPVAAREASPPTPPLELAVIAQTRACCRAGRYEDPGYFFS